MKKDPLFSNKILGAVLLAGVLATGSGFVANLLYSPANPEVFGYPIEAADTAPGDTANDPADDPADWGGVQTLLAAFGDGLGGDQLADAKKLFRKCASCHSVAEGGPNKVGPNLWATVDAPIAGKAGFSYSSALSGISDRAWTFEELNAFLANPKQYAPGTKMSYRGLKKASDRALMLQYLKTNG